MKRRRANISDFVRSPLLVSCILCALCVLCGKTPAQNFKQIHPGVEHAQVDHKLGSDPVKINLLRLDLRKVRLDVHHALDKAIGLETTSSIATRKGAVAAINAGFFRLDKSEFAGDASGILIINGTLFSEPVGPRAFLTVLNGKSSAVYFDRASKREFWLELSWKHRLNLDGINRERKPGEIIVYLPEFGPTTLTPDDGVEVVVEKIKSKQLIRGKGNNPIPSDGFIISASGEAARKLEEVLILNRNIKSSANFSDVPYDRRIEEIDKLSEMDVVGGLPQLIKDGKIDITWEQEKAAKAFVENRHPRTAVAKLKDGKFLMMTVDGRQPGVSVGMSLQELAEYLFSLGAVDAMNLDGGGSTTMFLDGKVVNSPSDKEGERKIGDAILVTLRKKK